MRTEPTHTEGQPSPKSQPSEFGAAALAIWGCIAFASVALTGAALLVPAAEDRQSERLLALQAPGEEVDTVPVSQPAAVSIPGDPMVDPVETASIRQSRVSEKPVPPQPKRVNRFGADIGGASSVASLLMRYRALRDHAPDLFKGVLPLVALQERENMLQARLVAGPFSSREERAEFCTSLKLRLSIPCAAAAYEGDDLL